MPPSDEKLPIRTTNDAENRPSNEPNSLPTGIRDQKDSEQPSTVTSQSDLEAKPLNPRLVALASKKATLQARLADLQAQRSSHVATVSEQPNLSNTSPEQHVTQALTSANAVIKTHITLLHSYNEIKDIGLGLMGLVAESRGVRVAGVLEDYGMSDKD